MDWETSESEPKARIKYRRLHVGGLNGSPPTAANTITIASSPEYEAVMLDACVRLDPSENASAECERLAEAIAAEWPTFCQYVQDRIAAAKAKEAADV